MTVQVFGGCSRFFLQNEYDIYTGNNVYIQLLLNISTKMTTVVNSPPSFRPYYFSKLTT